MTSDSFASASGSQSLGARLASEGRTLGESERDRLRRLSAGGDSAGSHEQRPPLRYIDPESAEWNERRRQNEMLDGMGRELLRMSAEIDSLRVRIEGLGVEA
jgi:hypothetical protein